MPRIRTVKPEFWEDEVVGRLSRDARLLFVGSWNLADDEGRLRWTPAYVRACLFMYDNDLTLPDVQALMDELVDAGLVVPYEVRDQHLAWVRNFNKHQVINRPTPSKLPEPPDLQKDADPPALPEDSVRAHGGLTEDSLPERKGRERKGSLVSYQRVLTCGPGPRSVERR